MKIQCENCNKAIPSDDINIEHMIAKCNACDSIFSITDQLPDTEEGIIQTKHTVDKPAFLKIDPHSHSFRMIHRWFNGGAFFFLFFALFWNSIVSIFVYQAIKDIATAQSLSDVDWFLPLFMIPFICVGIGTSYSAITGLFNRTIYSLDANQLRVSHGPFPWFGNKRLDPAQIKQFHVKKSGVTVNDMPRYNVFAIMIEGKDQLIAARLAEKSHALYIEQELERQTGISSLQTVGT
ncbi:hypothetical protein KS4_07750 [Poriferisphaera corsica]|uniref:Uncharacterized protein n=1 Tax=Poriferisphaera corsica TaxID=2528020 RepID=A0A517YRC3_9BACT|nr:hypothetical protein [Poriferisphaera corsica]QDU32741.1 hypothetical protein KS4_07750 [Poriferisphaera corsica]